MTTKFFWIAAASTLLLTTACGSDRPSPAKGGQQAAKDDHAHCDEGRDEHGRDDAEKDGHGHDEEAGDHGEGEHGHDEAGEGEQGVPVEGLRGVSFRAVEAERQESAWFAAEAVSDPSAETQVTTPVTGQVVAFHASPGAAVGRGQVVAELRSPEVADLQARWQAARARAEVARRDADREQRLLAGNATAAREAEAAQANAAAAEAEVAAAKAALEARGVAPGASAANVPVRALRAGTLAAFAVSLGETVSAGAKIATLIAPGAALARVELSLPGPEGWAIDAVTEARRSDGRRWPARVTGIPPHLAPDTRRLSYFLRLEGEDLPLAGTPLEVRVPLAKAVVLPQTALQQIEGVWGVFLKRGERAFLQPVRKGAELGGDVLILEGLEPGDQVATDGAYLLKALWLKRAGGGHGHDH